MYRSSSLVARTLSAALVALTLVCGAASAPAQDLLKDTLRDFRVGDHWIYDDWAAARRRAAVEKKPIFAVFRCVP